MMTAGKHSIVLIMFYNSIGILLLEKYKSLINMLLSYQNHILSFENNIIVLVSNSTI